MADFYLDHNVALEVASLLATDGHVATTARAIGREAAPDDAHLLEAAERGWSLVTHNVDDFVLLLHGAWLRWSAAWNVGARHSGILIIPQAPSLSTEQAARELGKFAALGLRLDNELYRLRPSRAWLRWQDGRGWTPCE